MIYRYQRATTQGPNGTTYYFRQPENATCTELAEVDGWHYVHAPDDAVLPEQHTEINLTPVELTDELKEQIKLRSRPVQLIHDEMQRRIRVRYPLEEEQYFARIGVGAALGAYQFQPGEQEAMLAFGGFVEEVRQWGRSERAKIGL
jgi:hypothetical protein